MTKALAYTLSSLLGALVLLTLFTGAEAGGKVKEVILLTDRNTAVLNSEVNGESVKEVQQQIMDLSQSLPRSSPIYLVLNSPGGSIEDGEHLIETIQGVPQLVHTISLFSASMSFIISQYADRRYITESGQMMSHRAYAGGLSGQVPGNLVTRTLGLLSSLNQVDEHVAKRAGMETVDYQALIRDELWMRGQRAIDLKFADELTRVRCAKSLNGPSPAKHLKVFVFNVKVVFHKCPLITEPISVELEEKATAEQKADVIKAISDPVFYLRNVEKAN